MVGGEHVGLAEVGNEDLLIFGAIEVPGHINGAIGGLLSVRVGAADALVDDQAFRPGLSIVLGDEGCEFAPLLPADLREININGRVFYQ